MGVQSQAWLDGIGDEWLERNRSVLGTKPDLPLLLMEQHKIPVGRVYEIGCSNGWRLKLQDLGWGVWGIDPSKKAIKEARKLLGGGAISLNVAIASEAFDYAPECDVIILGYCMSLIDSIDWPKVVGEVDRVLKPGGHLLIEDVSVEDEERIETALIEPDGLAPFRMTMIHWPNLWLNFPSYKCMGCIGENGSRNVCWLLKKGEFWRE